MTGRRGDVRPAPAEIHMNKVISAAEFKAHVASILIASGSTPSEANTVAGDLILANLSGHDSHGVGMLPRYVDAVLQGGLKPNSCVRVVLDTGSLLTVDGQRGYGQIVGEQAMTLGNAHHLGRIGQFAEMAVAQGLVSLYFVNVLSRPMSAPFGGADGRYGTNPCCIGVPLKGREPFVLDFATSRVAQGKMRVAYNEGRRAEPGTLTDEDGRPTTDPGVVAVPQSKALFGALLAFGEHKGYGLAVACELLGGALAGGGTWHQPTGPAVRAVINGVLTILIDPARLGTQTSFEEETLAFVDWLQAGPVAPGFDAVQITGDPERAYRKQRQTEGIALNAQTWQEIVAAGHKVGITLPG